MSIFISYSNNDKKQLNDSLVLALNSHEVEYWIDERIENGENISDTIRQNIQYCEACIFFATKNSLKSTWCAMEIAAFWGAGKKIFIYTLDDSITEEDFPPYLKDLKLTGTAVEIAKLAKQEIDNNAVRGPSELIDSLDTLREQLEPSNFFENSLLLQSPAMLAVALKYSQETEENYREIRSNTSRLSVPATDYPKYLNHLQQQPNARVLAIALVDEIERFWEEEIDIGNSILHFSELDKTQRIFVFKNQKTFTRLSRTVRDHCSKYNVRLVSEQNARSIRKKIYNFSLIWISEENINNTEQPPEETIVAYYKTVHGYEEIEFLLDPVKVKMHWDWFREMHSQALEAEKDQNMNLDMKRTAEKVFGLEQKEMSHYIPEVEKYDECERLHPYFQDMRSKMLEKLTDFSKPKSDTLLKILEFGAGTGILSGDILEFLKRHKIEGKLLSIEFDNPYASYLDLKYGLYQNFTSLQKDARYYDPPGKFDVIYSSFADHHIIKTEDDADDYYRNVRINLHDNSTFIVGDEFLSAHNYRDPQERINAITRYHQHIIEMARVAMGNANSKQRKLYEGLIELETEAQESGIRAVEDPSSPDAGDFKISIDHFQERLERNQLHLAKCHEIGPQDDSLRKKVGGIYVMEIKLV